MKIAMISGEYAPMPGGLGDFTRLLAEELSAQGHDIMLLSRAGTSSDSLPLSTVNGWGIGGIGELLNWLSRVQPDVINLQFQTAAYDMMPWIHFLPRLAKAPLVTTFHDLRYPYLFPKAGPLRNWIVRRLAQWSTGLIATNHEDFHGLAGMRRRLIPIGSNIKRRELSPGERKALRDSFGISGGGILLGHFGFIKQIKGVHHLLEALAQLRADGQDIQLVFIGGRSNTIDSGEDAAYLRRLDARIAEADLAGAIHWTGYLPDAEVAGLLGAVDLMVLPFCDGASYRRGSLMAAINQGCAIMTTEPVVAIDSFVHGQNMWLAQRDSSPNIYKGLAHLLPDGQQLAKLRRGAEALRHQFAWDAIARDTADFFQACM